MTTIIGVFGLVIVVGLILVAVFAPFVAPYDPTTQRIATAPMEGNAMLVDPTGERITCWLGAIIGLTCGMGGLLMGLMAAGRIPLLPL